MLNFLFRYCLDLLKTIGFLIIATLLIAAAMLALMMIFATATEKLVAVLVFVAVFLLLKYHTFPTRV